MIPLLIITGLLLVVSGGVKVHAGVRAGLGPPILSLVEVVAGLFLVSATVTSPPSAEGGLRWVYGGVGLVLISSVSMALRFGTLRREREESEGSRLRTYVKYLSSRTPE